LLKTWTTRASAVSAPARMFSGAVDSQMAMGQLVQLPSPKNINDE
jgi:hypothetical protein